MKRKIRLSIDAYHLKILAIITMVIDHSYKIFMPNIIAALSTFMPMNIIFFVIFIGFGFTRMSFPIFAYLIAEGCYHTKNKTKYLLRLFLFGLLSEIPFQYFISTMMGEALELSFGLTNVFFTLFLGALSITCYDYCSKKELPSCITLLPVLGCMGVSLLLQTDYCGLGVLMIFVCSYFHDNRSKLWALGIVITTFSLGYIPITDSVINGFDIHNAIIYVTDWLFMLSSVLILYKYNGKKGRAAKYFFYMFYPMHILLLLIIYYFFVI